MALLGAAHRESGRRFDTAESVFDSAAIVALVKAEMGREENERKRREEEEEEGKERKREEDEEEEGRDRGEHF